MAVSAKTLFHYTSSLANLKSILRNGFRPSYCYENWGEIITSFPGMVSYAVPMVCFCDIPLSQVKLHTTHYGRYGIGLTAKWRNAKQLNPVFYVTKHSTVSLYLKRVLVFMRNPANRRTTTDVTAIESFYETMAHIKAFRGWLVRGGRPIVRKKFYDEREWRFVEKGEYRVGKLNRLTKAEYDNSATRAKANGRLTTRLMFGADDVRYLLVDTEADVFKLLRGLARMSPGRFTAKDVALLSTRILPLDRILSDI